MLHIYLHSSKLGDTLGKNVISLPDLEQMCSNIGRSVFRCISQWDALFYLGEMNMTEPKILPIEFERKIDKMGRIVIPEAIRKKLKIIGGEMLIIKYTDKGVLISLK